MYQSTMLLLLLLLLLLLSFLLLIDANEIKDSPLLCSGSIVHAYILSRTHSRCIEHRYIQESCSHSVGV